MIQKVLISTKAAAGMLGCSEANINKFLHRISPVVTRIPPMAKFSRRKGKALLPLDLVDKAKQLREGAILVGKHLSVPRSIELAAGLRPLTSGYVPGDAS